jgi:hypothetical protein
VHDFKVTVNPRVPTPATPAPELAQCRRPEHGLESWGQSQSWTADSGWRKGGSSPSQYCGAKKLERERQHPDRQVVLVSTSEDHRVRYDPFKRDQYRYRCVFEDRWNPVYRLAANANCGA